MGSSAAAKHRQPGPVRRFFSILGPGVITGAADDDPSGIATYSIAGAQFGTAMLWTALLTWPLMAAVQMMCARIGMVTGKGLAGALRDKFPGPLLALVALGLLVANTINVGADLAGMSDCAEMLTGVKSRYFVLLFGIGISFVTIRCRYSQIAAILKWLALSLFAYIITAVVLRPDWLTILRDTILPTWPHGHDAWGMLVAILGTTISPYLFFWQASQEVEEEKAMGRRMLIRREGATHREIYDRKVDVGVGTFFSNLVMYFIILTTALTLHRHGVTHVETSRQAASALAPFAGKFASTLFTLGVIGVGLLAIPTLTGSAAYAFAETFHWREGLDQKFKSARAFYGVIIFSTCVGVALVFAKVSPLHALYWSAVVNGLLAPFLLTGILMVACDAKIMHDQPSSLLGRSVVAITALLMFGAGVGLFVF